MKTAYIMISILAASLTYAQVTIAKTQNAGEPANGSVSLEIGNDAGARGIVLPWVTSQSAVSSSVPGTLIFDSATQKVRLARGTGAGSTTLSGWLDLSAAARTPQTPFVADANAESPTAKVVIGSNAAANTTPGILVLSDTNKAMVLPRVNSYTDIVNPAAGMMVYVTSNNQLAVYNGREWTFWKP